MDYTDSFARDVIAYPGKTLVIFGAPWCAPCKSIEGMLEKFAQQVHIVKVNVDTHNHEAARYGISGGIPVVMMFNNGLPGNNLAGRITQNKLQELINGQS